jgi:ketosteroid isomerase-like protein
MSKENVEVLRASVAAVNRGDLEAALKDFDPYVVIRLDPSWPEDRPRFGGDAARSFFDDLAAMFGTGETVIEDVIDAGDRVVIRYRSRIHGQQSGIEDEVVYTQLVTFRGGKVVMLEWFLDHAEALEAAGLRE